MFGKDGMVNKFLHNQGQVRQAIKFQISLSFSSKTDKDGMGNKFLDNQGQERHVIKFQIPPSVTSKIDILQDNACIHCKPAGALKTPFRWLMSTRGIP